MTIQVELDPELGARLAAKARAQGMPLEKAAARILEEAMASRFTATRQKFAALQFNFSLLPMELCPHPAGQIKWKPIAESDPEAAPNKKPFRHKPRHFKYSRFSVAIFVLEVLNLFAVPRNGHFGMISEG